MKNFRQLRHDPNSSRPPSLGQIPCSDGQLACSVTLSQNQQLRILKTQANEQHAVNIRQVEVLEAQLNELREAPKVRELRNDTEPRSARQQNRSALRQSRCSWRKTALTTTRP